MSASGETSTPVPAVDEAVHRFKTDISSGKNWYLALLEAVKNWPVSEETAGGKTYHYIIADEAFDLLQVAERLLKAAGDFIPEKEKMDFLFHNKPPAVLTPDKTKELLGDKRFGQYLNFFYGVTAEEALLQAVEEEVRKEEGGLNMHKEAQIIDETYRRIYEEPQRVLLHQFRKEKGYASGVSTTLQQMKEFSYWRFKYRLQHCEKPRIASDTKKALDWMRKNTSR
ncbi:MAG: hypothetical protein C4542_03095 [Dehalococcoidia bacterium]|nr:MAG: hypothetical protein C4542_03095 [Dehalococcoidia bacterium]